MPEFKFSLPAITLLTDDQQLAYDPRNSILVTGGPGSGKTVVTIYRFLRAVLEKKNIMLFTYNRTLIYSIKGMLRDRAEELFGSFDQESINKVVNEQLSTFYKWHVDHIHFFEPTAESKTIEENFKKYRVENGKFSELFFDEGQDLPPSVFANAHILTEIVSVGADRAQNYKQHYLDEEVEDVINEVLSKHLYTEWQYLGLNFRNTKEIFELAKKFVPNDPRVQKIDSKQMRRGNNPEIRTGLNQVQQLEVIRQIIEANQNSNIGILLHFPEEITTVRKYLENLHYSCALDADPTKSYSYYYHKMSISDEKVTKEKLCTPFLTTFESCKGLEFDVVIMPFFETSTKATTGKNSNNRNWVTQNHYYVAATRAKNDLFIICNDIPFALSAFYTPSNTGDDDLPF